MRLGWITVVSHQRRNIDSTTAPVRGELSQGIFYAVVCGLSPMKKLNQDVTIRLKLRVIFLQSIAGGPQLAPFNSNIGLRFG